MSDTYNITCIETGEELWIGQDSHCGELGLYTSEDHIEKLRDFLHRNSWKPLIVWNDYADYEGSKDRMIEDMKKKLEGPR